MTHEQLMTELGILKATFQEVGRLLGPLPDWRPAPRRSPADDRANLVADGAKVFGGCREEASIEPEYEPLFARDGPPPRDAGIG